MTLHEDAALRLTQKWMSTPDGALLVHDFYTGVQGRWDEQYVDMLGQHYRHSLDGLWPAEQICCFGWLHLAIERGSIGFMRVRAHGEPGRDRMREANAELLADLPEPFEAEVDMTQNGAPSDGWLRWTMPINIEMATSKTETTPGGLTRTIAETVVIGPGELPLEIGSTLPSRTVVHMGDEGGVARWPYGSDLIWVLADMDRRFPPMEVAPAELVASGNDHG